MLLQAFDPPLILAAANCNLVVLELLLHAGVHAATQAPASKSWILKAAVNSAGTPAGVALLTFLLRHDLCRALVNWQPTWPQLDASTCSMRNRGSNGGSLSDESSKHGDILQALVLQLQFVTTMSGRTCLIAAIKLLDSAGATWDSSNRPGTPLRRIIAALPHNPVFLDLLQHIRGGISTVCPDVAAEFIHSAAAVVGKPLLDMGHLNSSAFATFALLENLHCCAVDWHSDVCRHEVTAPTGGAYIRSLIAETSPPFVEPHASTALVQRLAAANAFLRQLLESRSSMSFIDALAAHAALLVVKEPSYRQEVAHVIHIDVDDEHDVGVDATADGVLTAGTATAAAQLLHAVASECADALASPLARSAWVVVYGGMHAVCRAVERAALHRRSAGVLAWMSRNAVWTPIVGVVDTGSYSEEAL